jgi:glycine cleavage system H lipoate-binding protein
MEAGIVSYKLCNLRYECETCSFDQLLKKNGYTTQGRQSKSRIEQEYPSTNMAQDAVEGTPEQLVPMDSDQFFQTFYDFKVREDLFYHPGHTWMAVEGTRSVTIGLDEFIVKFLPEIEAIILPTAGNRVDREYVCCWIVERDGTYPITAPVSGRVTASNRLFSKDPTFLVKNPYTRGWLMKIDPENLTLDQKHLYRMDEILDKSIDDLERLRSTFESVVQRNRATLGPTQCDGGKTLLHIRDIVGPERYVKIISRFLSGK